MAIRRPPDDYIPRIVRRGGQPPPRVIRYEEPPPSFLVACFVRPKYSRFGIVVRMVHTVLLILDSLSSRIDNLLKGEVLARGGI